MTSTKRPRNRRSTILTASAELFADRGFVAVGIDEIAAEVGVTGPAIYRHFKNKEALFVAVLEDAISGLADALDAVSGDSDNALESALEASVDVILDNPTAITAYLHERWMLNPPSPSMIAAERRVRRVWDRAVAEKLAYLDKLSVEVRLRALFGAFALGARLHGGVSRLRLEELLVTWGAAVMHAEVHPAQAISDEAPRWRPAATRHEEILDAALLLFRARGVGDVGIDEIGVAAGISGPTVYYYFPSKAHIVLGAFDRAGERVTAGIADVRSSATSPVDALERLIRSYVGVAMDTIDLIVLSSRERDAVPTSERERFRRRNRIIHDGWTSVVREVRPDLSEAETQLLVRTVFPLMHQAVETSEGHGDLTEELVGIAMAYVIM
jgi:AcrR family transcriptional regulator